MKNCNRCQIVVQERLPISQEKLWDFFVNTPNWHPTIRSIEIHENCKTIYLTDGRVIHEYIDKIDPIHFELEYHFIKSPYPIADYQAKFRLRKISDHECEIIWSSDFLPDGDTQENVIALVESIYRDGINHLRQLLSRS